MTTDDLLYLIGRLTVEKEALIAEVRELRARLEAVQPAPAPESEPADEA